MYYLGSSQDTEGPLKGNVCGVKGTHRHVVHSENTNPLTFLEPMVDVDCAREHRSFQHLGKMGEEKGRLGVGCR